MNLEKSKDIRLRHKLLLNCNPTFAESYRRGETIEIDFLETHGNRLRIYPKFRKNNWEYVYHKEVEITLK